jgi:hypothetical protein
MRTKKEAHGPVATRPLSLVLALDSVRRVNRCYYLTRLAVYQLHINPANIRNVCNGIQQGPSVINT